MSNFFEQEMARAARRGEGADALLLGERRVEAVSAWVAEEMQFVRLTPLELAREYARLRDVHHWSEEEIAYAVAVPKGEVSRLLALHDKQSTIEKTRGREAASRVRANGAPIALVGAPRGSDRGGQRR